jgi:hypothetical protein
LASPTAFSASIASEAAAIQAHYYVKRAYSNFNKDKNWKAWSVSTEKGEWCKDFENAIRLTNKAIEIAKKAKEATSKARDAAISYIQSNS